MTETKNIKLPQWEGTDQVKRADFNDAFAKIDAALGRLSDSIIVGSFTGASISDRTVNLPWTPRLVIVSGHNGGGTDVPALTIAFGTYAHSITGTNNNMYSSYNGGILIVENGFKLTGGVHGIGSLEDHYIAIR